MRVNVCSSGALLRRAVSSLFGSATELHEFQLVKWKLSFTSTIPTLIRRVTVLSVKDHRHVRKFIFWVGRAKIPWRA